MARSAGGVAVPSAMNGVPQSLSLACGETAPFAQGSHRRRYPLTPAARTLLASPYGGWFAEFSIRQTKFFLRKNRKPSKRSVRQISNLTNRVFPLEKPQTFKEVGLPNFQFDKPSFSFGKTADLQIENLKAAPEKI